MNHEINLNELSDKEVFDKLTEIGVTPIFCKNDFEYDYDEDNEDFNYYEKHLSQFDLLKALQVKCVKVYMTIFTNNDLMATFNSVDDIQNDDDDDFDDDTPNSQLKDLTQYDPRLNDFKENFGKISSFRLEIPSPLRSVTSFIYADWFSSFLKLRFYVIEKAENEYEHKMNKLEEIESQNDREEEKNKEKAIGSMWELINDSDFCKLSTQKAQIEYAIEKIPALEEIDYSELKLEMQKVKARIIARGLDKRK